MNIYNYNEHINNHLKLKQYNMVGMTVMPVFQNHIQHLFFGHILLKCRID